MTRSAKKKSRGTHLELTYPPGRGGVQPRAGRKPNGEKPPPSPLALARSWLLRIGQRHGGLKFSAVKVQRSHLRACRAKLAAAESARPPGG